MPSGTATKRGRAQKPATTNDAPSAPVPAPSPEPEEPSSPDERVWADEDEFSDAEYVDVQMPVRLKMVRVRYLLTPEVTRLQYLPDLAGFKAVIEKLATNEDNAKDDRVSEADLAEQNAWYGARVIHLAVVNPKLPYVKGPCPHCDGKEHEPSLWTPTQAAKVHPQDSDFITAVALRAREVLDDIIPFSTETQESPSRSPASTGESTLPTK
jgi:hypothetical protein